MKSRLLLLLLCLFFSAFALAQESYNAKIRLYWNGAYLKPVGLKVWLVQEGDTIERPALYGTIAIPKKKGPTGFIFGYNGQRYTAGTISIPENSDEGVLHLGIVMDNMDLVGLAGRPDQYTLKNSDIRLSVPDAVNVQEFCFAVLKPKARPGETVASKFVGDIVVRKRKS